MCYSSATVSCELRFLRLMKVILLQDVAKIGKRFETVDVPDGYALNMLIPKRMAEPATPENLKRVDARRTKAAAAAGARRAAPQDPGPALHPAQGPGRGSGAEDRRAARRGAARSQPEPRAASPARDAAAGDL